jgi:hypothetical protein
MDSSEIVFGWILGGTFLIGLVSIVGGLLQSRRVRFLTHLERMKALEVGRELPSDAVPPSGGEIKYESLARKCFSTAFWVGLAGGAAAASQGFIQTATPGIADLGIAIAIVTSTGAIGVTALICGTVLATKAPLAPARRAGSHKFESESDAFDVVSTRG